MKATKLLYQAAGEPAYPQEARGVCRVCGDPGYGVGFAEWVRDTFMDWDKLVPGEILCPACQFAFDDDSRLLMARLGKEQPQRMRAIPSPRGTLHTGYRPSYWDPHNQTLCIVP